jgi:arylsulfatase A-like enzyme
VQRRRFFVTAGLGMASFMLPGCSAIRMRGKPSGRPNIVFIMADDHAAHAIGCYGSRINQTPHIDRIARQGVRFDNCFCTNSICAPSRAVILTGKHSHLNGVRDNSDVFDGSQVTFPHLLRSSGYHTAFVGKWHLKSDPTGFDHWDILPGQGHYYNPDMIEMGKKVQHSGYVTDILTEKALNFLEKQEDSEKPFLLMLHHKAPHRNWQPPLRHLRLFDGQTIPEPETLFDDYATRSQAAKEQEMSVADHLQLEYDLKMGDPPERMNSDQKSVWESVYGPRRRMFYRTKPQGRDLVRWKYRRYMEDYLGCVAAVDESVGRILDSLESMGLEDRTLVVYTSDQGFYLGDHGWYDKRFMYEEAMGMPLVMKYPGKIIPGSINKDLVSNLDFAPTFLDMAQVYKPEDMQGISLRGSMQGRANSFQRDFLYYHYYEYPAVHMVKRHDGLRGRRFKLIHFYHDIEAWELYDLEKDPNELCNVIEDPAYASVVRRLKAELKRLREYYQVPDTPVSR